MKLPLEGGCRCDRVRIRVTKAPLITTACHCRGCQKMSSSAFSLTAIFPSDALEILTGEPVVGGMHAPESPHFFCAWCMTWMFTRPAPAPQIVNVRPTMFDDHAWASPFIETYAGNKLPGIATGATHSFPEFPPMTEFDRLMREYAARRSP
jgi:hypothetical protein